MALLASGKENCRKRGPGFLLVQTRFLTEVTTTFPHVVCINTEVPLTVTVTLMLKYRLNLDGSLTITD